MYGARTGSVEVACNCEMMAGSLGGLNKESTQKSAEYAVYLLEGPQARCKTQETYKTLKRMGSYDEQGGNSVIAGASDIGFTGVESP